MDFLNLTPEALLAGLLVSSVGTGLFLYGKKSSRPPQLAAGIALMLLPMAVSGAAAMLTAGGGLVALMVVGLRAGL